MMAWSSLDDGRRRPCCPLCRLALLDLKPIRARDATLGETPRTATLYLSARNRIVCMRLGVTGARQQGSDSEGLVLVALFREGKHGRQGRVLVTKARLQGA